MTAGAPADVARWDENRPTAGLARLPDVREVIAYRRIAWYLARRDIQLRYKQTLLGAGWTIIKPLVGVGLFTIVFGGFVGVPSNGKPYAVFVFAGLLGWTYFSGSLSNAAMSLLANQSLVTKIYFPRLLAPISGVLPGLLDFAVGLPVLAALMAIHGVAPGWQLATLPVWLLVFAGLAFGFGCLLGAAMVTYRDVGHGLPYLLQLGLFATPIVYPSTLPTGAGAWVIHLNPLVAPIDGLRWALIGGDAMDARDLASLAIGALLATAGVLYFCRVERRFADVI
jgi:lipopolysaccharide transport system permease protein